MITGTKIPATLPRHTQAVLRQIDCACAVRAVRDRTTKIAQANELLAHAQGSTLYFARLYAALLDAEVAA